MSDTPLTDAEGFYLDVNGRRFHEPKNLATFVSIEFARTLECKLAAAQVENQEQARLLGMSGSREAKLRAEIERWRDSNIRLRDEMQNRAARANAAEWDLAAKQTEAGWLRAALKQLLQRIDSIGKEADRFPDARDRAAILMAQSILTKTPSAPAPDSPPPPPAP